MPRFKLNAGTHVVQHSTGRKDGEGKVIHEDRYYRASDPKNNVIETDQDLTKLNCPSGALGQSYHYEKFTLLHEAAPGHKNVEIPDQAEVYDPTKETIEQFVARVTSKQAQPPAPPMASGAEVGVRVQEAAKVGAGNLTPSAGQGLPNFDSMTDQALLSLAEDNEVNIPKGAKRADLLKALRAAGIK